MPNAINVERQDTLPIPVEAISIMDNKETQDPEVQVMVGSIIVTIVASSGSAVAETYNH